MQFFDVGQGDGTFIVFPNRKTMLVDLGSTKNKDVVLPDIKKYFQTFTKFEKAGEKLDYLILTHGDSDHYNLIKDVFEELNIGVRNLYCGGSGYESTRYTELIAWLCLTNPNGAAKRYHPQSDFPAQIKDDFGDGAEVWILAWNTWHERSKQAKAQGKALKDEWSRNTDSIVLSIGYKNVRVLLTGDATVDTERAILADLGAKRAGDLIVSDVLKVAHHGSRRTSNHVPWIQAVNPEFVFISADRHGTLDPDNDDVKKTGHRLPQRLTTDLIKKYARELYNGCDPHDYVTAYDLSDYTNYDENPDNPPNEKLGKPQPGTIAGKTQVGNQEWIQETTTDAIFTTLTGLDTKSPDGDAAADQGAQYQLTIDGNGIRVDTTVGSGGTKAVVKKASGRRKKQ